MPKQISFDKAIYVRSGVEDAVQSYASMAQCTFSEEASRFVVELVANEPSNEALIADHFTNHVLFATLSRQGQNS